MGRNSSFAYAVDGGNQCTFLIIIVGAMIQTVGLPIVGVEGSVDFQTINVVSVLGAIAVFLASINIFGGFAVTARMLEMFKPKQKKKEG